MHSCTEVALVIYSLLQSGISYYPIQIYTLYYLIQSCSVYSGMESSKAYFLIHSDAEKSVKDYYKIQEYL